MRAKNFQNINLYKLMFPKCHFFDLLKLVLVKIISLELIKVSFYIYFYILLYSFSFTPGYNSSLFLQFKLDIHKYFESNQKNNLLMLFCIFGCVIIESRAMLEYSFLKLQEKQFILI